MTNATCSATIQKYTEISFGAKHPRIPYHFRIKESVRVSDFRDISHIAPQQGGNALASLLRPGAQPWCKCRASMLLDCEIHSDTKCNANCDANYDSESLRISKHQRHSKTSCVWDQTSFLINLQSKQMINPRALHWCWLFILIHTDYIWLLYILKRSIHTWFHQSHIVFFFLWWLKHVKLFFHVQRLFADMSKQCM